MMMQREPVPTIATLIHYKNQAWYKLRIKCIKDISDNLVTTMEFGRNLVEIKCKHPCFRYWDQVRHNLVWEFHPASGQPCFNANSRIIGCAPTTLIHTINHIKHLSLKHLQACFMFETTLFPYSYFTFVIKMIYHNY